MPLLPIFTPLTILWYTPTIVSYLVMVRILGLTLVSCVPRHGHWLHQWHHLNIRLAMILLQWILKILKTNLFHLVYLRIIWVYEACWLWYIFTMTFYIDILVMGLVNTRKYFGLISQIILNQTRRIFSLCTPLDNKIKKQKFVNIRSWWKLISVFHTCKDPFVLVSKKKIFNIILQKSKMR